MNIKKHFFTTYDLILSALFIALISVGSFVKIPLGPVPITLQFMFVLLAGQMFNPKCAVVTLIIYTVMGILGLPIFSGGGGVSYILTPTFGYILGFVFAALAISVISHSGKRTFSKLLLANFTGFAIVYIFGLGHYILLSHFYFNMILDLGAVLLFGFVVFIPTDLVFCILTAIISKRLSPIIAKHMA